MRVRDELKSWTVCSRSLLTSARRETCTSNSCRASPALSPVPAIHLQCGQHSVQSQSLKRRCRRSMGARSAVAVCKRICDRQKDAVQGVLCLSFPLNLPGKPQTNVERSHGLLALPNVWSVLFVSGTADNMCEQNLLQSIMHVMKSTSAVHWVKDANHGLTVRGRTEESVLEEVSC
ncbi:LOW QUALITY PROTEIN: testis-expressed sequence 30 protein [Sinocyclocheilus grahami]|uniref:LOW QUALITY PROTEIN: testis-expressed sequence 30 protein n=1 Tax=Sinocyclocheilus grahami TaxID=75366 RepID=UPI0007AD4BF6|nr:PREDICTED: LOW QUALITY PROTEIN: testis-expressed sequence 30 protein [Sinocyclocheilus grahami]